MSAILEVAMPEPLSRRLAAAATARGETLDQIIRSALEAFLHDEDSFRAAVRQGLDSLDAGRTVGLEEVAAKWEARRQDGDEA